MSSPIRWSALLAATSAILLATSDARAQVPMGSSLAGFGIARSTLDIQVGDATARLTGTTFGGDGRLALWKLMVDVRYLEGELSDDAGNVNLRLIEAEALVGIRPIPWLALLFGPHVRKIADDPDSQNSAFWTVRAQAEAALLEPFLFSYVEIWQMLFGQVDAGSFDNGQGAEAGLIIKMETVPIWARLGYRIDHATFEDVAREETVQHLVAAFGLDVTP